MMRTRQNVMSLSRPGQTNEAVQLINYLSAFNAIPSTAYSSSQPTTTSYNFYPGMKDVPQWLKSLRLHKYTNLFMDLTYEEMLNLNQHALERRGITLGARGKILQSIAKLKRRPFVMREMITQLDASKDPACRCPIIHLRQFLSTPIRPYVPQTAELPERIDGNCHVDHINDQNVPALLVMLLQKVQNFIINCRQGEVTDDFLLMLFKAHDLILSNEAFTENQKRRVTHLKKQAKKYCCPGELRRKVPGPVPFGKCEFCEAREALVGPMPIADFLPPATIRPKEVAQKKKNSREKKQRNRLPELEIGEWNPVPAVQPLSPAYDMNTMAHYINMMNLQNQRDPCRQPLLHLAPTHPAAQNRSSYVATASNGSQYDISITRRPVQQPHRQPQLPPLPQPRPLMETTLTRSPADLPGISNIPQYRSRTSPAETPAPVVAPPAKAPAPAVVEKPKKEIPWPTALYDNSDLEKMTAGLNLNDSFSNLWFSLNNTRTAAESGDTTSGYSSSTSDRGSGAGSPRTSQDSSEGPKDEPRAWNTWDPSMSLFLAEMTQAARC